MEQSENITILKEERLSVASKLLMRRTAFYPALAYFGGRTIHYKITELNPNISFMHTAFCPTNKLDEFATRHALYKGESEGPAREEAYAREFPVANTLDSLTAMAIGIPLTIPAFLVGLLYTEREEIKDILDRVKK